jgi:hypothetical protein
MEKNSLLWQQLFFLKLAVIVQQPQQCKCRFLGLLIGALIGACFFLLSVLGMVKRIRFFFSLRYTIL